jgi:hypothetical protein
MGEQWVVVANTCYDEKCPTIWQNRETGAVRLRGYALGDRSTEHDIEYSAEEWAQLRSQLDQ